MPITLINQLDCLTARDTSEKTSLPCTVHARIIRNQSEFVPSFCSADSSVGSFWVPLSVERASAVNFARLRTCQSRST